jgi:LysM domain
MATVTIQDQDTWDSIAADHAVPLSMLLLANGIDPDSTPETLQAGSTIRLPDAPPDLCVAPDHDHVTDIQPDLTNIWIRLDMSADDAQSEGGYLRLYSTDGTYDVTVPIAGNYASSSGAVDVPFDHVDSSLTYSLEYRDSANRVVLIIGERTVDVFQDSGAG